MCVCVVPPAACRWSSVLCLHPFIAVVICVIDAAAAVADVAAVTQLLVVGPPLTEQLSKLI